MKMKTFSKIAAIALTVAMTACMSSCEDERDVPTYGTGVETQIPNVAKKSAAELESFHLDGTTLCVHLIIWNANSSMTADELVTVKVIGGDGATYYQQTGDGTDYDASLIYDSILDKGYKYHIPYAFNPLFTKSDTATVTVIDNYSGLVIGEWEVDVTGINDVPWVH